MRRVLLTGATGRIGRQVIPLLLERGYAIRALIHRAPALPEWQSSVEVVAGAIHDPVVLERALSDVDAVIHLAAVMPPASNDQVFHSNIEGTYRLLEALTRLRPKPHVLFASSDATYCTGWSAGSYSSAIDESFSQKPTVFYGLSKTLGEAMCQFYGRMHALPLVQLRFVWTLEAAEILDLFVQTPYKEYLIEGDNGIWDEPNIVAVPLEENGSPFMEHICDVRDAADAVVLALESEDALGSSFNIAGPEPFLYTKVVPELASALGKRPLEGRCRGIHSYSLNLDRARSVLGYRPHFSVMGSLQDALRKHERTTK